jgi:hypothetical protein
MIIKNLEALKLLDTEQKIYDYVLVHLRQQNAQSVAANGDCMYRNPTGLACAIGCLIPETEYHANMEDINVNALLQESIGTAAFQHLYGFNSILIQLQHVHDGNTPKHWETRMESLALQFNVKYTPPVKAE